MTVKELIYKLLEEDMNAEVQLSIDEPHQDEHGKVQGYVFDIDSVSHEFGGCMIKFTDWRKKKNEGTLPVGEWFVTKAGYFKCSHCGYEPNFVIGEKMYPLPATVYCPKCGTKMPSEEKRLEERKANFLSKCLNIKIKGDEEK